MHGHLYTSGHVTRREIGRGITHNGHHLGAFFFIVTGVLQLFLISLITLASLRPPVPTCVLDSPIYARAGANAFLLPG